MRLQDCLDAAQQNLLGPHNRRHRCHAFGGRRPSPVLPMTPSLRYGVHRQRRRIRHIPPELSSTNSRYLSNFHTECLHVLLIACGLTARFRLSATSLIPVRRPGSTAPERHGRASTAGVEATAVSGVFPQPPDGGQGNVRFASPASAAPVRREDSQRRLEHGSMSTNSLTDQATRGMLSIESFCNALPGRAKSSSEGGPALAPGPVCLNSEMC